MRVLRGLHRCIGCPRRYDVILNILMGGDADPDLQGRGGLTASEASEFKDTAVVTLTNLPLITLHILLGGTDGLHRYAVQRCWTNLQPVHVSSRYQFVLTGVCCVAASTRSR